MNLANFIFRNPWARSLLPLLLMGVASLSISLLASQIYSESGVDWMGIPNEHTFYIFLVATISLCAYEISVVRHDKKLLRGITPKQYEAAIRNTVAEVVAKRSKKLIRNGEIEQLEKETDIFNRLYGEAKK